MLKVIYNRIIIIILLATFVVGCSDDAPPEDSIKAIHVGELSSSIGDVVAFGEHITSQVSEQVITIENTGENAASSLSAADLNLPFSFKGGSYPGLTGTCADTLQQGQSCTLVINYSPDNNASHSDQLTISYNNQIESKSLQIGFSGKGLLPANLSFDVADVNFGDVVGLESKSLSFIVQNVGEVAATSVGASLPAPFNFSGTGYPGYNGNCAEVLDAGESCSVEVEFSPTSILSFSENISFSINNGLQVEVVSLSLLGVGILPQPPVVSGLSQSAVPVKSKTWSWSCDQSCEYRYAINQSLTYTFLDETWGSNSSVIQGSVTGVYYIHVQARNTNFNQVTSSVNSVGALLDNTNPSQPGNLVFLSDAEEALSATVSWDSATDNNEVSLYMLAVGSTLGASNIVPWTPVGNVNTARLAGSFTNGIEYFTSIKAVDQASNEGGVITTSAWMPPGPPAAVNNLSIVSAAIHEITIGWAEPYHNGLTIADYFIEYKESTDEEWIVVDDGVSTDTTSIISELIAGRSYDFRIKAFNGSSSEYSNIAVGETTPDDPFFEPTFYKAMNLGGATASQVTALDDETLIELIRGETTSELITLNAGGVFGFISEQNDILRANKPIFVAGRKGNSGAGAGLKGNMVWNSPDWAGKEFIFSGTRLAPHLITVYAFEDSEIEITLGDVSVAVESVDAGKNHTFSLIDYGGFKMVSTGLIIAHMHSSESSYVADPKPLLPASLDILGIPSRDVRVIAVEDATDFEGYHSDSTTTSNSIDRGEALIIDGKGTVDRYKAHALRIKSTKKLVGNSNADFDGYCAAPFVPVGMMKKRYAINVNSQWVALASLVPGTITVTYPDGTVKSIDLVRTGTNPLAPYKARVENGQAGFVLSGGTRFEADFRFAAWYEPNSDNYGSAEDETILFGFD